MLTCRLTLRAGNNTTRVGSNINTRHRLVVALELVLELEGIADLAVELNCRVSGDSKRLAVGRERVVRNGVVEEMVNFGSGHVERCAIGVALYYLWLLTDFW